MEKELGKRKKVGRIRSHSALITTIKHLSKNTPNPCGRKIGSLVLFQDRLVRFGKNTARLGFANRSRKKLLHVHGPTVNTTCIWHKAREKRDNGRHLLGRQVKFTESR